jgi:hypothetical protein
MGDCVDVRAQNGRFQIAFRDSFRIAGSPAGAATVSVVRTVALTP